MKRRAKRFEISLHGDHWKVLVYGCTIPWMLWCGRECRFEKIVESELRELFQTLHQHHVSNFVLVGLIVVTGVPEDINVEWKHSSLHEPVSVDSFERAFLHQVFFHSAIKGAHFEGPHSKAECGRLKALLVEYYEQAGWNQHMCPNTGNTFWDNARLKITTWHRIPRQGSFTVGSVAVIGKDQCPAPEEGGYLRASASTLVDILYIGSPDHPYDAGWMYVATRKDGVRGWVAS